MADVVVHEDIVLGSIEPLEYMRLSASCTKVDLPRTDMHPEQYLQFAKSFPYWHYVTRRMDAASCQSWDVGGREETERTCNQLDGVYNARTAHRPDSDPMLEATVVVGEALMSMMLMMSEFRVNSAHSARLFSPTLS